MLELRQIKIKNFWSYGDYDTIVKLDDLGPCLITGDVSSNNSKDTSNGAGKSALVDAILWCLFGRTKQLESPGDRVVNWFTGKNCIVELEFKNGDIVRRTRKVDGHNDLLLIKDGDDKSLGTSKMQQQELNRHLKLDWDIFCGSTFFAQFGKSWMEISSAKRKEALEREFAINKIRAYANVAKDKLNSVKLNQSNINSKIDDIDTQIADCAKSIGEFEESSKNFKTQQENRIKQIENNINELKKDHDSIKLYDINKLQKEVDIYNKIQGKVDNLESELDAKYLKKRNIESDIASKKALIKKWKNKEKICSNCEQPIPRTHVNIKIKTPKIELDKLNKLLININKSINVDKSNIEEIRKKLESKSPDISISEAKRRIKQCKKIDNQISRYLKMIKEIKNEDNHYNKTIENLQNKIKRYRAEKSQLQERVKKLDILILHLNYVYRCYHDRRKIKSHILAEYIPYFNSRITYYLDKFEFDINIEFTNALGTKSSHWEYASLSGGERKKFDVAMMLSMFDLHVLMYGRQCNVIVFDEIDGKLDVRGAEIFSDIIKTDFTNKVDSILMISQRVDMREMFSTEIHVSRDNDRFSRVDSITR